MGPSVSLDPGIVVQRYRPNTQKKTKRTFIAGFTQKPDDAEGFDRLARFQDAVQDGRAAVRDARTDEAAASPVDDDADGDAAPPESSDAPMVRSRMRIAAIVVVFLFVGLLGRAFSVQIVEHDRYFALWDQSRITEKLQAVRGSIVDRNGEVYAITRLTGKSLYVVPKLLKEPERGHLARLLASELKLDVEKLHARFIRYAEKEFVWVKRHLTDDEEETLTALVEDDPAVGFRHEMIRLYPQGQQLANVLGFVGTDGAGLEGLEMRFNSVLHGTDGERELLRDARGRRIGVVDLPETLPRHGASIELTVDHVIQAIAEDALDQVMENWKPKSCTALVMNPHTGEVLAMATRPTYDPANRRGSTPEQWRNRVVADVFEPGSIFKPTIMMAALEEGLYRFPRAGTTSIPTDARQPMPGEDRVFCENGAWPIREGRARRTLHDVHGYGWLGISGVIIKSSNIGMAKVGRKLGHRRLLGSWNGETFQGGYISRFGFGRRLGIDVPGEENGFMPPHENYPDVFTVPSVTMGHSIGVTPLQVLTCFNQIANGGYVLRPVVVLQARDVNGHVVYRRQLPQVIDRPLTNQAALDFMKQTLVRVCMKGGTAPAANLDDYGITVAGKTGTAEKVVGGRYSSEHKVCSFLAFAPAENPVISVLVTVDEPSVHYQGKRYYGGTVAAPAVRDIVLRTLRQRTAESFQQPQQQSGSHGSPTNR